MRCPFGGWAPGSAQWEGVVGEKKRMKKKMLEEREREVRRMRNRTRREGGGWANRCFALTLFLHRVHRPPDA